MTSQRPHKPRSERLTASQQIDVLCDRFEEQCRNREAPIWNLEADDLNAEDRKRLFREFLRIEMDFRKLRGEDPQLVDYLQAHPEYVSILEEVFAARDFSQDKTSTFHISESAVTFNLQATKQLTKTVSSRYRTVRPHAEGGLGCVVVAVDEELQREVAVKQLRYQVQGDAVSQIRFLQEAQLTARLEHPGIVPIYGMGIDELGAPFYIMRFVNGETLRQATHRLHQMPGVWRDSEWFVEFRKLLSRFISVCQTIDFAHSHGVVHRDIKPSNILLGKFGETLLVDWGLAKAITSEPMSSEIEGAASESLELTSTGMLMGTPLYMSPEQAAASRSVDPATDIYGLGATLATLLSGKPPVEGATSLDVINKIKGGDIRLPKEIMHDVPAPLNAICGHALRQNPGERYSNAGAMASDLELWLAGEVVSVWCESSSQRMARWVRRHKLLSQAAAAVVVIALVMTYLAAQWASRERHRERLVGLVEQVASADLAALPEVSKGLKSYGLESVLALKNRLKLAGRDPQVTRNLKLALSSHEDIYLEQLLQDLLQIRLQEYLILRDQLRPYLPRLAPYLWNEWQQNQDSFERGLRIAGALAICDAGHPTWSLISDQLAELLCREATSAYGVWTDALKPVSAKLELSLRRLFGDPTRPALARSAAELMGLMFQDRVEVLVDSLQRAEADQLVPLIRGMHKNRMECVELLQFALSQLEPVNLTQQPHADQRSPFVERDRRRARAACALLSLNHPNDVWPWLEPSADPTFRSLVVELVPYADIDSELLHKWWRDETHSGRRRTMTMMLAKLPRSTLSNEKRTTWLRELVQIERSDPDPGVHSAAQWVISNWCQAAPQLTPQPHLTAGYSPDHRWYELRSGETFAIVQGPVEFLMGSPQDEYRRNLGDALHLRRINHSFAIATREITCEQAVARVPNLMKFCPPDNSKPGVSAYRMSWYDAACYCRRLSEEEGIPEDQMCFPPVDQIGAQMVPPENYLQRTGYRIPTQAEWEYGCRAGTITAGYFGDDPALHQNYAWSVPNSSLSAVQPGQKKPNDLGLFDTLGNVHEWCFERCQGLPYSSLPGWGRTVSEEWTPKPIAPRRTHAVRGGDVNLLPMAIKSSSRFRLPAGYHDAVVGFRPVRTLPANWSPFDLVQILDTPPDEVRYRITGEGESFRIDDVDASITVEPRIGIAPAEITVRGAKSGAHRFHFTLTQLKASTRRTVAGYLTHFNWDVQVHPALASPSTDSDVRATLLSTVEPSLASGEVHLHKSIQAVQQSDELSVIHPQGSAVDESRSDLLSPKFAVFATATPKLIPGEYFAQLFGDEVSTLSVQNHFHYVNDRVHQSLPDPSISATLRVTIRNSADVWRSDVFTSSGKAELWTKVRPVPTLP